MLDSMASISSHLTLSQDVTIRINILPTHSCKCAS